MGGNGAKDRILTRKREFGWNFRGKTRWGFKNTILQNKIGGKFRVRKAAVLVYLFCRAIIHYSLAIIKK